MTADELAAELEKMLVFGSERVRPTLKAAASMLREQSQMIAESAVHEARMGKLVDISSQQVAIVDTLLATARREAAREMRERCAEFVSLCHCCQCVVLPPVAPYCEACAADEEYDPETLDVALRKHVAVPEDEP